MSALLRLYMPNHYCSTKSYVNLYCAKRLNIIRRDAYTTNKITTAHSIRYGLKSKVSC